MIQKKLISSKQIIARAYSDLNIQDEKRIYTWIDWIGEALEKIGGFSYLEKKGPITLTVENYRTKLPCDYVNIISVRMGGKHLIYGEGNYDGTQSEKQGYKSVKSYSLQWPWIFTFLKEGELELIYEGMPLDEDGFPLVVDLESVKEACVKYIIYKEYYSDFISGKIAPQIYMKMENDWIFYCGQAKGVLNMPNVDQLESIKNMWLQLKNNVIHHSLHFSDLNKI